MTATSSLYAFYDLGVSPLSFDFVCFLVEAERYRRSESFSHVHLVFVPPNESFKFEEKLYDTQHETWRLTNLLVSSCWLLPSCRNLTVCRTREEAREIKNQIVGPVFPQNYSVEVPVAHHHTGWPILAAHQGINLQFLEAPPQARAYARQWLNTHAGGKKPVVLTLREASFTPKRNSNFKVWAGIAQKLKQSGFFPVVVRDIETVSEAHPPELDGIATFSTAAFNLEMRMALFEESHICAFVSNGPSTPCYYSRNVRYIYFVTGEWLDRENTSFNRVGIVWGSTPPFANNYQRWIWREQDADAYAEEILDLDRHISGTTDNNQTSYGLEPLQENRRTGDELAATFLNWCKSQHDTVSPEVELAFQALDSIPSDETPEENILRLKAELSLQIHDRQAAFEFYERAGTISNNEIDYTLAGDLCGSGINHTAMLRYYNDVLKKMPQSSLIQERLQSVRSTRERFYKYDFGVYSAAAEKFLEWQPEEEAPDLVEATYDSLATPEACVQLAAVYMEAKNHELAAEQFERAFELGCTSGPIMLPLGICYISLGRIAEAIKIFEEADKGGVRSAQITLALGQLYQSIGEAGRALEIYSRAEQGGYADDAVQKRKAELIQQS